MLFVRRIPVLFAMICALGFSNVFARDAIEVQSRYTGDGWFHYRLRTLEDPFFTVIGFGQLIPSPFTNYVESVLPAHWTNFFAGEKWHGIMGDGSPQPRLNEISFSVKSTSTHYKRKQYGFNTTIHVEFFDEELHGLPGLAGYANLHCLIPCSPEEADGSPPEMIHRIELVPDIEIDELISTNGSIYGVKYSWSASSTVILEASPDMVEWNGVARIFGNPPQTTWTTNSPLNSLGKYFRLSLVARGHTPGMTSESSTQSLLELLNSKDPARYQFSVATKPR